MRTFFAESQAVSVLQEQARAKGPQFDPLDGEVSDGIEIQPTRARLRVAIPPNYLSGLLVPAITPPSSADEFKDLPNAARGIRDSWDVGASEPGTRFDQKETREHRRAPEPKSPAVVELETELEETKSTLQDIRMRGQLFQTQNDVLARQAERIKSACGLLVEGNLDYTSWRSVFDESSPLLQSHPLSRLRIGLDHFTSQLTSAFRAFHEHGTWNRVTSSGLGNKFQEVCDLLNDLMGHAEVQYLPRAMPRARSHSVPVATTTGYPSRPPVRPKPSSLRSPTKLSSPCEESKRER